MCYEDGLPISFHITRLGVFATVEEEVECDDDEVTLCSLLWVIGKAGEAVGLCRYCVTRHSNLWNSRRIGAPEAF